MKKVLFLLVALMLAAPIQDLRADNPPPPANPKPADVNNIPVPIFLNELTLNGPIYRTPGRGPRRPAQPQNCLKFEFPCDLGVVSVELQNDTTGEYSQSYVETASGSATVSYSGTQGHWTVTLTTADGDWARWEFVR